MPLDVYFTLVAWDRSREGRVPRRSFLERPESSGRQASRRVGKTASQDAKGKEAILIITDIRDYPRFMLDRRQCARHGQIIIRALAKAIIRRVKIPLEISKREGVAMRCYQQVAA
ncbi:MAG: hypothetical protein ACLPT6_11340 [Desulfobaccales bacterium]